MHIHIYIFTRTYLYIYIHIKTKERERESEGSGAIGWLLGALKIKDFATHNVPDPSKVLTFACFATDTPKKSSCCALWAEW